MPCLSIQVSDWVDEHGECGDCEAKHVDVGTSSCCRRSASLVQMVAAVKILLQGIGEDVGREGILKTPFRVASAFRAAIAGYLSSADQIVGQALFTEAGTGGETGCGGGSGGTVLVRNIDSFALCESCLLPFRLRCHVIYISCDQRVVGLSKFPRVAEIYAKRLQNPQKFANELVQALNESFMPLGIGVVVESWHLKWPGGDESRDNGDERSGFGWVPATAYAGKGQYENIHCSLWDEFLTLLQLDDVVSEKHVLGSTDENYGRKTSCPFLVQDDKELFSLQNSNCALSDSKDSNTATILKSATIMAIGVESMLRAMGEDPTIEELQCTALRFVTWLLSATQGSRRPISNGQNNKINKGAVASLNYAEGNLTNGVSMVDNDLNCSVNGLSSQSNGMGNADSSLTNWWIAQCKCAPTNDSRLSEIQCAMSNGRCSSSVYGTSGVENMSDDVVCLELDVPFSSLCEHHLLPFYGSVHLGYIPGEGNQHIDRTVVKKIVTMYSRRLQVQERLTRQILEAVVSVGPLQGAMVVAEASHMCIISRGAEKLGSTTVTVATIDKFSTDGAMRAAFLKRISQKASKNMG